MLALRSLCFDYPDKSLLSNVDFVLEQGQLLHLRGNNGVGKTTLLKLLAGLLRPDRGDIQYQGQSIYADLPGYRDNLCYVGHKAGISALLTVRENCYFDLHWQRRSVDFEKLLSDFGLGALADEPCYLLSAGQRRRVGLLRIAMTDAQLWLLDEPLVALDQPAIEQLMFCFQTHLQKGGQILLTSHQNLPLPAGSFQEYCL